MAEGPQKELLAATLASIGDAVIVTDAEGRVTFLNGEAEKLTGWNNNEAQGQALPVVFHIVNENTRQAEENPVNKVLRSGKVVALTNHTLLVSKDGREIPIDDTAAPIRRPGGPISGVVLIFRDFTEQRKSRETHARLAAIVEHSGDAIFTKNLDGIIQTWNNSAERLFGYRADEIIGKPVSLLFPPDRLNEEDHIIGRLRQGRPSERLETIRLGRNGRRIPVRVNVSPIKNSDGEVIGASKIIHDITDVVAAREALVQEKELLATTLASIGDAVVVTDAKGRVNFLNIEAERLTGWENSEAAGQTLPVVFRIINEKTRQPAENPIEKVLRQGTTVGLANHTLLVSKGGQEIPIDDSAAPIRRPGGPVSGVVLVFRDSAEQRKSEEARAHLAAIVEHSGDAIFAKNLDGVIQTWNASAERLFGYRAEEIMGKPVSILFPPDRLNEEDHILDRLRRGQPVERLETVRVGRDGRRIPVSVSVSPLKNADGEVIGASKIIHDITDLVTAREALVREKELLATTLASIGDGVIVTDARGRVTFLNAEAERLTGWKNSDAAGQSLGSVFRIVNETTRQPVENPVEKVLRHGTIVGLANHTVLISKDGREIPIDDSAAPIRRTNSPVSGVVLVFRDFTAQKEAEQILERTNEELEERVRQRTATLQEMVGELEHVSYAITHDMRAPLRAMNGFAEILVERTALIGTAEDQDYSRRILVAASRLDKLIRDALHYTKAVLQDTPMAPVDLTKLISGLVETYPNLQPEKAEICIADGLPVVLGNEALLTQCFSNLLGNSVKFVPRGTRPKVCVRAEIQDGMARIWVEDNGIGIPRHAQQRLFKMFQRLTNEYEGSGIGLAIVRKVVERMGGKVGAESEPGKGSRFWAELRVASSATNN